MSWPAFLYEKYSADMNNLEGGLFRSNLLLQVSLTRATWRWSYFQQAYKAIFTSPSSAKEVAGDGDATNVIENNRRAKKDFNSGKKVKTHVAQIIRMHKVTPRSIAYVACQVSCNHCVYFSNWLWILTIPLVAICTFFGNLMALGGWRFRLRAVLANYRRLLRKGPWSSSDAKGRPTSSMVDEVHCLFI